MKTVRFPQDLQTTKEATVNGFKWQAQEKSQRASQYTEVAKYFRKKSSEIRFHDQFIQDHMLYLFAVGACALSQKSLKHLSSEAILSIFSELIDLRRLNEEDYLVELEGRYFLTCGDSLGGAMRNVVGQAAQCMLSEQLFRIAQETFGNARVWRNNSGKITSITWDNRTIVFDKKPKFIDKSVDFILLNGAYDDPRYAIENPDLFLLAGELKGGIDPAGADEHWKTARSALDRISVAFSQRELPVPVLVFVGAAIEASMANEIYDRIISTNFLAANLTKADQLGEVINYIVRL